MVKNPLQQYFRQPKVFVAIPSQGIYNKPTTYNGDLARLAIYGMTGMDEIMLKTPDALITGESTVKVLESCCPEITDGWDVSNLDVDALLVAVRIATYGNIMNMVHTCKSCSTENTYELDVSKFLEHFSQCSFDPVVKVDGLTIRIRPLSYKQVTEFNLENFALQKRLFHASQLEDEDSRSKSISQLYRELGTLQNKIMFAGVEQVETPSEIVTDPIFINEWLSNADKTIFDAVRDQVSKNNAAWKIPDTRVKCENCGSENSFSVDLDQSSFFASA
jgi:hypothetical protein